MDFTLQRWEDLLSEASFVQWVNDPQSPSAVFWEQWCLSHPEFENEIQLARELILGIEYKQTHELTQQELNDLFSRIVNR